MGTSKSMPTPKGGKWTDVKREINDYISGEGNVSPQKIVGSTIAAAGGLSLRSPAGGSGGGGGGGRVTGGGTSGRSVARTISGLAGFGTALGTGGLTQALNSLGIEDLRGKPAGEVISRIADHLSADVNGLEQDILRGAIQQAIYNAAELADDPTYENLEASLQTFLSREGIEGLIELFLTQYVFDRIWLLIEDHVNKRTDSQADISNMETAVEQACRSNVHNEIERHKIERNFDNLDWFGRDGLRIADTVITDLESRLQEAAQGGAE
jgi:hypothetical protein